MENTTAKPAIMLYTEQTPNPESLKFVSNRILYKGIAEFKDREVAKEWSPMADALYTLEYVKAVYISNNFVTITKNPDFDWHEIMVSTKEFIKKIIDQKQNLLRPDLQNSSRRHTMQATRKITVQKIRTSLKKLKRSLNIM